jgi:hypothetical protein
LYFEKSKLILQAMPPELRLPGGIIIPEQALAKETEVKYRASARIAMGRRDLKLSRVKEGPYREIWLRLRESANPISPSVLWEEGTDFFPLVTKARNESSDRSRSLARYLSGVWDGLMDARRAYVGELDKYSRLPIGDGVFDKQDLIEQLAAAEANLILTRNGYPSIDHRKIIDPEFYLGRVYATEHALGRMEYIPTRVHPVPKYLH